MLLFRNCYALLFLLSLRENGKQRFFSFDENPGRRAITRRVSKAKAYEEALQFANVSPHPVEIGKPGKAPW